MAKTLTLPSPGVPGEGGLGCSSLQYDRFQFASARDLQSILIPRLRLDGEFRLGRLASRQCHFHFVIPVESAEGDRAVAAAAAEIRAPALGNQLLENIESRLGGVIIIRI